MKLKIVILVTLIVLIITGLSALVFLSGCDYPDGTGIVTAPPQSKPVWKDISPVPNPRKLALAQEGGDLVLEGAGEVIGFSPIAKEDRQVLAIDWSNNILGFYTLDLHTRTVTSMGGIRINGILPKLESMAWPWVLLHGEDDEGNRSWILVDLSSGQAEIAWESYAWVPPGLRHKPVWFNGESWNLGPVSGPAVTDAITGSIVMRNSKYDLVNPVSDTWPRWAGGVSHSKWYLYPVKEGGSALVNLDTGMERLLEKDQNLVWNHEHTMMAWSQDGQLGLLDPIGKVTPLVAGGIVPGTPLWSGNGDRLFFLGGEDNYFGTTWKSLWAWDNEVGANRLFDLPGSWTRWRLMAATDEAVLAAAGDNGEHLVYFDVANQKTYEFSSVQQWLWQEGTLIALQEGEMLRLSPGFEIRTLAREAEEYKLLGFVNQFVLYSHDGRIFIKQLTM